MTPALPDILVGQMVALMIPLPPEAGGDYQAGRAGLLAMLAGLAAQEAERGTAARIWENGAIRELLGESGVDSDFSWRALDAANAELRRRLIAAHEAAEAARDEGRQRDILALYQAMAKARRLDLPV
ncbi:MAG TPA: hypothetical protein VG166_04040 [Caulobacteraceae bacterium]|jgi:hypothetical protein|nr:hypothetical protein [Caulobacteraceae bacterium]